MYNKIANFYDELGWGENAELEADIINNVLMNNNIIPENYLDLGCGTGELIKILSDIHDEATFLGLDISEDMIDVAKKKLKANKNCKFITRDMRALKLEKRSDCITCMYDTINHLLKEEYWVEAFNSIYDSLKFGGVFIMDMVPSNALKNWPGTYVKENDNSILIREISYDKGEKVLTTKINAFIKANYFGTYRNVREEVHEISFDTKKVINMLKKVGFKKIDLYNENFEKIKPGKADKEDRVYFSCMK